MLAGLYIGYIIVLAKFRPDLMPPLSAADRHVDLPPLAQTLAPRGSNALAGLWRALRADGGAGVSKRTVLGQLFVTLMPALFIAAVLAVTYRVATTPEAAVDTSGLVQAGGQVAADVKEESTGLIGAQEPEKDEAGVQGTAG